MAEKQSNIMRKLFLIFIVFLYCGVPLQLDETDLLIWEVEKWVEDSIEKMRIYYEAGCIVTEEDFYILRDRVGQSFEKFLLYDIEYLSQYLRKFLLGIQKYKPEKIYGFR